MDDILARLKAYEALSSDEQIDSLDELVDIAREFKNFTQKHIDEYSARLEKTAKTVEAARAARATSAKKEKDKEEKCRQASPRH